MPATKKPAVAPLSVKSVRLHPLTSALRLAGGALGLAATPWAQAATTFVVPNGAPDSVTGSCVRQGTTDIYDCSNLRIAINTSNGATDQAGAAVTIDLTGVTDTITLTQGQLSITAPSPDGLIIQGPGANRLTISGNDDSRIFFLHSPNHLPSAVTISGLTLRGGNATGNNSGGAIYSNNIDLNLQNSIVTGNATGTYGGGLYVINANASLVSSAITQNTAGDGGGGIGIWYSPSNTTNLIIDTLISGNSSSGGGGGIYTDSALTISSSTISDNDSVHGGGIFTDSALTISSSTISGNRVSQLGGGIFTDRPTTIVSSTISGNQATDSGGGIFNWVGPAISLHNTIVAGNTTTTGEPDLGGDFTGDYNFVGILESGASLTGGTHNQIGSNANPFDPLLGALSNNGGPTLTQLPNSGSPVIGAGDCLSPPAMTSDQRGYPRALVPCTIGAVEYDAIFLDGFE